MNTANCAAMRSRFSWRALAAADPHGRGRASSGAREDLGVTATFTWSGRERPARPMAKAAEARSRPPHHRRAGERQGRAHRQAPPIELNECGHPVPDSAASRRGAHRGDRMRRRSGRSGGLPDLGRRFGAAACAGPADHARRKAGGHAAAAGVRREYPRDQRRPQAHFARSKADNWRGSPRPRRVESLLLSDVIGDDLDVIGSGPTAPDASTFASAFADSGEVRIARPCPGARPRAAEARRARRRRSRAIRCSRMSKTSSWAAISCRSMRPRGAAKELGYRTLILSSTIEGETRRFGAHARRHRAPDPAARTARAAAGLHHFRRRDHRHDARRRAVKAGATRNSRSPRRSISPGWKTCSFSAPGRMAATAPPTRRALSRTARR